jgi:uncharacterized cupredoxin-like copper-binding protein
MAGGSVGMSATGGTSVRIVNVTLSDFKIEASQATFRTGVPCHFVVTNSSKSTTNHEFTNVKPMTGDGMSMTDMDKMALHSVDASQLPLGARKSFDFTFTSAVPAGQLEFACHVGSHYELGMREAILVTRT